MDEGADDDDRDQEADDEPDGDGAEADSAGAGHQAVVVLDQLERRRPKHRRYGEEEAEFGRGAAFDPEAEAAHDRGAGAADPRHHGQALNEADADHGLQRHFGYANSWSL